VFIFRDFTPGSVVCLWLKDASSVVGSVAVSVVHGENKRRERKNSGSNVLYGLILKLLIGPFWGSKALRQIKLTELSSGGWLLARVFAQPACVSISGIGSGASPRIFPNVQSPLGSIQALLLTREATMGS